MQALGAVTYADLAGAGQTTGYKLELWDGADWINLCDLDSVNYVKSLSLQLGGAGATPDPIAASWSAEIHNYNGIFHPRHPTSAYSDYFRVGRKVRISYGATYGGTPYYWQRMIGYMDPPTFNSSDQTISISGGDYMTALVETALHSPNNYWGTTATFSSVETTKTFGTEMYEQYTSISVTNEADDLSAWTVILHGYFVSLEESDLGSTYVAHFEKDDTDTFASAANPLVGAMTVGKLYEVSFKYQKKSGANSSLRCVLYETVTSNVAGQIAGLESGDVTTVKFHFTAPQSGNVYAKFWIDGVIGVGALFYIDQFSFREITARANTRYPMPEACNGIYFVTLDGDPLWYGDNNRGWFYDDANMVFYMDDEAWIETGTDNIVVYYFTTHDIMDVLGDVLAASPLYTDRAAALAALNYIDPGVTVDKAWFRADAGTPCVAAIQKICERCGYRFWFAYDGVPQFLPAPTLDDPIVSLETRHKDGLSTLQDLGEIRNNVVIEGIERGAFSTAKDKDTSRMRSAAALDATSIAAYLERTYVATNDLFQTQASLDAAAAAMLADFKDPKWYATLDVPHNPIPLELGDTVGFSIPLAPGSGATPELAVETRGIIRDIALSEQGFSYKVEMESGLMNIANYTQASSPVTVSAEQCKGWVLTNAGATAGVHFDLPAAVVGMEITFYVMAAYAIQVDPNGTDQIMVLTGAAGDYLASDAVVGSYIVLGCLAANKWHKLDIGGTWTEE